MIFYIEKTFGGFRQHVFSVNIYQQNDYWQQSGKYENNKIHPFSNHSILLLESHHQRHSAYIGGCLLTEQRPTLCKLVVEAITE